MRLLDEELLRRHDERRNDKVNLWTTWLVRIILLIVVVMIIRHFSDVHLLFFKGQANETEQIKVIEENHKP